MDLPVMPPVLPMLAKAADRLPTGAGLIYEPKWDGFRCIVFRDGDEVELASRNQRPLTRYFPEVVEAVRRELPSRCVLDGEIVLVGPEGLDFDALSQRIHPAESRITMLASSTPARLVVFDLLALGDSDLRPVGFAERRRRLEGLFAEVSGESGVERGVYITPATTDPSTAEDWFERFEGAGLDGVVVKPGELTYQSDRRVMIKVKHERTGDFVVAGFRWYRGGEGVGSLMLGVYDEEGDLVHVGVIGSFSLEVRRSMVAELDALTDLRGIAHPWTAWDEATGSTTAHGGGSRGGGSRGGGSRWNAGKDLSFVALRPELVVEAAFEHLQGRRLRHTARFVRWRPDRDPSSCKFDQLSVAAPAELASVFALGSARPGNLPGRP
jgi:ATP-dependent DNA ligase